MKYPYKNFDWKKSFVRLVDNARYEDGFIKIYIPDPNLFLEIRNAIESKGGFVDITLNSKLLKIAPEYYLWLMFAIASGEEKKVLEKSIKAELKKRKVDVSDFAPATVTKILKDKVLPMGLETLGNIMEVCAPGVGGIIGSMLKGGANLLKKE